MGGDYAGVVLWHGVCIWCVCSGSECVWSSSGMGPSPSPSRARLVVEAQSGLDHSHARPGPWYTHYCCNALQCCSIGRLCPSSPRSSNLLDRTREGGGNLSLPTGRSLYGLV